MAVAIPSPEPRSIKTTINGVNIHDIVVGTSIEIAAEHVPCEM
jgi:hypothetical protein